MAKSIKIQLTNKKENIMEKMNRREFLNVAGLSAAGIALSSTQVLGAQKPLSTSYGDVHDRMITIDGVVPLLLGTFNTKDFDRWIKGGVSTIGVTVGGANYGPEVTMKVISWFSEQIQTRDDLMFCRTADDIRNAKKLGKLGIFYHFQGPSSLDIDLERVWYYKQMGVGIIQLAYNTRNPFANGISERVDGGLSILGQKLVQTCNEARVVVDVSHTGFKSSMDAIEASSEPVILSHANARGKINNPRNVPDELLKAIAKNGGFAGAVAYPAFVSNKKIPTMDDMVGMIDYMVDLMGIDHVTMGLDYDSTGHGILPEEQVEKTYKMMVDSGAWDPKAYPKPPYHYPQGMELPDTLQNLTGALLARGYKEKDLAKIWGGNWLRVMDQVWGDPKAELTGIDHDMFLELPPHTH